MLNTAGGLTGDDRLDWSVTAGADTTVTLVSSACEKLYRTHGPPARVTTRLRLAAGARLEWLPQETIVHDGAALDRSIEVDMHAGSRLLMMETLALGRQAMGESVRKLALRDRWRVRRDGVLVHSEALELDDAWLRALGGPAIAALPGGVSADVPADIPVGVPARTPAAAPSSGQPVLSTVLYLGPESDEWLQDVAANIHEVLDGTSCRAGVSGWRGKLLLRVIAPDSERFRRHVIPTLERLRADVPMPRIWQV